MVYIMKFIKIKIKKMSIYGPIQTDDLLEAETTVIKITQALYWATEIENLLRDKIVGIKSKLKNLQPFLENSLMRVDGRLKNARYLGIDQRHPILIPEKS